MGIRLANYVVAGLRWRGDDVELIDAKAIGLPMLDRMYKEYPKGGAPAAMEALAEKIRTADAFVFVTGEYNWGAQPGLKNLTDHFLEEWFWRPAAIASYSGGRLAGARSNSTWHGILSEMGMVVISSTLTVGPIGQTLDEEARPTGTAGQALERSFPRFADDLAWWAEAAREQRLRRTPPLQRPCAPRPRLGQDQPGSLHIKWPSRRVSHIARPSSEDSYFVARACRGYQSSSIASVTRIQDSLISSHTVTRFGVTKLSFSGVTLRVDGRTFANAARLPPAATCQPLHELQRNPRCGGSKGYRTPCVVFGR